jgi:hypothetical protein
LSFDDIEILIAKFCFLFYNKNIWNGCFIHDPLHPVITFIINIMSRVSLSRFLLHQEFMSITGFTSTCYLEIYGNTVTVIIIYFLVLLCNFTYAVQYAHKHMKNGDVVPHRGGRSSNVWGVLVMPSVDVKVSPLLDKPPATSLSWSKAHKNPACIKRKAEYLTVRCYRITPSAERLPISGTIEHSQFESRSLCRAYKL